MMRFLTIIAAVALVAVAILLSTSRRAAAECRSIEMSTSHDLDRDLITVRRTADDYARHVASAAPEPGRPSPGAHDQHVLATRARYYCEATLVRQVAAAYRLTLRDVADRLAPGDAQLFSRLGLRIDTPAVARDADADRGAQ